MDEKQKPKSEMVLDDQQLYQAICEQNSMFAMLSTPEQNSFNEQNSHYRFENGKVSLEYFGAKHIREPSHSQFSEIQKSFYSFIEGKDPLKTIVLVEASVPAISHNIEYDVRKTGERGFTTHLAAERGVKVKCLEPGRVEEVEYLLQDFKPEYIEYYYYLRGIRDYFRSGAIQAQSSFEEYSNELLKHHKNMFSEVSEFSNFDFSLEKMKLIHKQLTGNDFDQNNRLDVDPRKNDSVINKISQECSNYRDFYHIKNIEKYLSDGYSVFVVNGSDHAIIQKPFLESFLQE